MDSTNAAMEEQDATEGRAKVAGHWKWVASKSANLQYYHLKGIFFHLISKIVCLTAISDLSGVSHA